LVIFAIISLKQPENIQESRFLQDTSCNKLLESMRRSEEKFGFVENPYEKLRDCLSRTNSKFRDLEFATTDNGKSLNELSQKSKRPFVLFPSYGISAIDIAQGSSNDCWLLQSLCSSAYDHPDIVRSLFTPQEFNPLGFYVIKLWSPKENRHFYMLVDDIIPFSGDKPKYLAFTNSRNGSPETGVWTNIIEKAFAKLMNSWDKLDTYNVPTESATSIFQRILKGGSNFDDWRDKAVSGREKFDKITSIRSTGASISLTSASHRDSSEGIVSYHGYSLFEARTVQTNRGPVQLIKAKNVWGRFEWNGAWSDSSKEWKENPQLVRELNMVVADDGVFWINSDDFVKHFWIIWYN